MHNRNAVAKKVRASLKMIVMSKNMLQTQLFIYSIAACTCSLPPRTVYSIRPTTHHSIHAPRRLLSTLCPVQCCTLILGADHSFTGTLWTPKCTWDTMCNLVLTDVQLRLCFFSPLFGPHKPRSGNRVKYVDKIWPLCCENVLIHIHYYYVVGASLAKHGKTVILWVQ